MLGTLEQIQLYNYQSLRLGDIIGYSIAVLGLIVLIFYVYGLITKENSLSFLLTGIIFFAIGTKITMQTCLMTSLATEPYTSFYFFWLSFSATPLLIYLLHSRSLSNRLGVLFRYAFYIFAVFFCCSLILIILNINMYSGLIPIYYAANILILTSVAIQCFKQGIRSCVSVFLMIIMFVIDVLNHYVQFMLVSFLTYDTLWVSCSAIVIIFKVFDQRFRDIYARKNEYNTMRLKSESLLKSYREAEEYAVSMEKIRHDMRKHLNVVDSLLRDGRTASAGRYLQSIIERVDSSTVRSICPNHIVNAIIHHNIEQAKGHEIEFTYNIRLPEYFGIDDVDLCSVFANCLDNAIEACTRIPQKKFINFAPPIFSPKSSCSISFAIHHHLLISD